MLVAGVPGFTFGHGEAYGLHVAWSGNTVHRVERVPSGLGMTGDDAEPREGLAPGATTIGGGRIDLGMLERVQRVWTSDMTDALARQSIQRWTGQLVPPEYLGAHVSASFLVEAL